MTTGDGVGHELGWLRATLESLGQQLDRHIHLEAERARDTSTTLREILRETKSTNGRVNRIEEWQEETAAPQLSTVGTAIAELKADVAQLRTWREQREPVIALVRSSALDGAAVQRWWQKKRGQLAIVAGAVTFVAGGIIQLAAAVKALGW